MKKLTCCKSMRSAIEQKGILTPEDTLGRSFSINRGEDKTSWIIKYCPFCGKEIIKGKTKRLRSEKILP